MSDKKISQLTAATTPLVGTEVLPIVQNGATVKVTISDVTAGRDVSSKSSTVTSGTATPFFRAHNTTAGLNSAAELQLDTSNTFSGVSKTFIKGESQNAGNSSADLLLGVNADGGGAPYNAIRIKGNGGDVVALTGNFSVGTAGKGIDFSADPSAAGMTSELLDDYEEGTWTPTDGSGAGLSFTGTSNNCFYTKVGNLVTCVFSVVYPTTASGLAAVIAGLPFTSRNTTNSTFGGYTSYTDSSLNINFLVAANGTTVPLYLTTGAAATNTQLSTRSLRGVIIYTV